jgi:hypothetical protein
LRRGEVKARAAPSHALILGEFALERKHQPRRYPLRAFANRFPPYRRRAHRVVQLALCRHHGGKFLLRIEDTDKARSTQAAIDAIIEGMRWLELDWDGDA